MKFKHYRFLFLLGSLLICLFAYYAPVAHAAGFSVGINPPIAHIVAKAPAQISTPFTIQNDSDTPVNLDIMLKPFTASKDENGTISYVQSIDGPNPLIFQYVKVIDTGAEINNLTLSPGQIKKLNLSIDIPANELPSDYYFSVIFISKDTTTYPSSTRHTITAGGIAMNVLLSIGPKGTPALAIEEFSTSLLHEKGPAVFTIRIKNIGDQVIAPKGYILIKNMFGQTVGKVDLLTSNILAGTIRALPDSLQSPEATPSGKSEIRNPKSETPVAVWPESLLIGPYTATLHIQAADNTPVMTSTTRFVGLPLQTALGLFLALLALLFIRKRVQRRLG